MTAHTESKHGGDFIDRLCLSPVFHIEEITVAAGEKLAAGAVVGTVTDGGKCIAYNSNATDGSENPSGILCAAVDASAGDVTNARILARGPAVVNGNDLIWDAANDDAAITAGKAALDALGIQAA